MFAIDDLSDAIDVTRRFLTPVRLWTWLKLALVVFFVGGIGFNSPTFSGGGFGGEPSPSPDPGTGPGLGPDVGEWLPILVAIALVVLVLWLVYSLLSAMFEFTLLESLRSGEVRLRRDTSRNTGRGVRLFGFRLAVGLAMLLLVGGPLAAIFLSTSGTASMALLGLVVLLAIPAYLVYAVVNRFTTVFVAPTMLQEDLGVVAAWKRFWPTLTANWTEYLVYLLLVWILQLVMGFAIAIVFLILAIPFIIVFVLLLFVPFLNVLFLALGVPLFVLLTLLVQVPVVVYLRYYALLVLGDTDADLDLIPERRAAVRGGDIVDSGRDSSDDRLEDDTDDDPWGGSSSWDESDSDDGTGPEDDSSEDEDRGGW